MLIICIILIILAIIVGKKFNKLDKQEMSALCWSGAFIIGVISLLLIIFILKSYYSGYVANEKIIMYQEENIKIEEEINVLVEKYMNHEKNTLKEFKTKSSITLVSLYPELKSDELVKRQIEVYIRNNNEIKELKEKKIDLKLGKWLLYFG